MAAMAANNAFHPFDPPQPSSPASPTSQSAIQPQQRSFIHLNQGVRGQHSPFPTTPTTTHPNSILEPPTGVPYSDFIRSWSDHHVARWLNDIKCGNHAPTFKANDIRGDIVLELDQPLLKEMGIASIGDRLRIINAVKALRQRSASRPLSASLIDSSRPKLDQGPEPRTPATQEKIGTDPTSMMRGSSRGGRPAPLQLNPNINRADLPRLEPDSATRPNANPVVRPLPLPSVQSSTQSSSTPGSSHSLGSTSSRTNLPPLPPPPGKPPPPPSNRPPARPINAPASNDRRTPQGDPAPPYTTQPLHIPPHRDLLTPSPGPSRTAHLPSDPRPGNPGGGKTAVARSTSPLLVGRITRPLVNNGAHARNGSLGSPGGSNLATKLPPRPSTGNSHPYATATAQLAPQQQQAHNLSPIAESFLTQHTPPAPGTPPPPSMAYTVGRGPFHPNANSNGVALPLDALRRKLVKFSLPDEGLSSTIDVASCAGGVEILEKVLKKFGKAGSRSGDTDGSVQMEERGLSIDGWGVYLGKGQADGPGELLTEAELLTICHSPPDHPSREHGLTVRKIRSRLYDDRNGSSSPAQSKFLNTSPASKSTKRASSVSVLSGLGVSDPEKALNPPSPTSGVSNSAMHNAKRPSKLRNFFGQRPPSELISNHLTEFFPAVEKKVLERTARHSMMLRINPNPSRRDSAMSHYHTLPSRFSSSTQGSQKRSSVSTTRSSYSSLPPPPPPENRASSSDSESDSPGEELPRMSLSTDDGRSVELHPDDTAGSSTIATPPQLLPPIPTTTESFSESFGSITGRRTSRSPSGSMPTASRRMSYMTELRSKRDRSDTASLMTVDEITAEVESRRASMSVDPGSDTDDWTRVSEDELESETMQDTLNEDADSEADDAEDATCVDNEDDDQPPRVTSRGGNKWIKGALIGAGSFGKVYLGMDASNGLLMAVKQVELPTGSAPNQERKKNMLSALEREIELLKNLQHVNIVQYLYSSIDNEYLNIFLEYVPGGSVTALLRNYGAFEETLVKNFVRQILEGLNYLHERDIIHRDIKGANILVDNKGGIKISDFGISKKVDDNLLTGNRVNRPSLQGSVFWMAPEVVKQSIYTKKADIWSVGCLVVEMLTGDHPWAQLSQMQAIYQIGSSAKPTIPSDISADAQDFLRLSFETNHEARPSASELSQHSWIAQKPTKKTNLDVTV